MYFFPGFEYKKEYVPIYHFFIIILFTVKHLGEEPFKCNECGKTCRSPAQLRRHIRLIHKGQKYSCHLCGKEYPDTKGVKYHISKVHETEVGKKRIVRFNRDFVSYFKDEES